MRAALLWRSVMDMLPLAALRALAWLLVGFAATLAASLAGVIANLTVNQPNDRARLA